MIKAREVQEQFKMLWPNMMFFDFCKVLKLECNLDNPETRELWYHYRMMVNGILRFKENDLQKLLNWEDES